MKTFKSISNQLICVIVALVWVALSVGFVVADKSFTKYQNSNIQFVAEKDVLDEDNTDTFLSATYIHFFPSSVYTFNQNFLSQIRLLINNNPFDYLFRHCSLSISVRSILI